MCRADVAEGAIRPLAQVLATMARVLAERAGVDPREVRIGPVDFGEPHDVGALVEGAECRRDELRRAVAEARSL